MSHQRGHNRSTEYTKWAASRPGVPSSPSDRRFSRNPLQRPVLTMLGILAFVVIVGGGAYAMFGAGGPVVSANHDAVVDTLDLDGTIFSIAHYESDVGNYLVAAVQESRGFLSDHRTTSLRVIEQHDGTLEQVASLDAPIDAVLPGSIAIVESITYVPLGEGSDGHGIWMIDISDPVNPEEIDVWADAGAIASLEAAENDVLIGHVSGAFQFLDVSRPDDPEVIGTFRLPVGSVQRMEVRDGHLYHRESGTDRIAISDISDLESPGPLGRHLNVDRLTRSPVRYSNVIRNAEERLEITAPSRHYQDFVVNEDVLYVASSDLGLEIVDMSDPTSPATIERIQVDGRAVRTAIADDVLYVVTADEHSRERLAYEVHAFDITESDVPALNSTIDDIRAASGRQAIETSGSYLFLGLNGTVLMIDRDS
jgi:hypothetical protein